VVELRSPGVEDKLLVKVVDFVRSSDISFRLCSSNMASVVFSSISFLAAIAANQANLKTVYELVSPYMCIWLSVFMANMLIKC